MQIELHQECAMTPDPRPSLAGGQPDVTHMLGVLAAASDWQSFCEVLDRSIATWLPSTRLDIYAIDSDGLTSRRYTSEDAPPLQLASAEIMLRDQLPLQGYGAMLVKPLVGAGRQSGWLVLARRRGSVSSAERAIAEALAPLIALWLRYDQTVAQLAHSRECEALLEQRLQSTQSLRLRATLAAGAAHDIGNLFTTVLGYAQILQQDLPADFQDDLRMISRAAEDGRELLRRLQVDERVPIARATLETSVAQIVRDVAKLTRPLWERQADVRVQTLLDGAPMVRMPAEELREVLVNLLMNAIAAVTEAGTITIYGRAVGDRAMISVTDTGQGIARENHSAIFQPLMTTRVDGSGLGLSVSRALVESNGGTLIVESEPGQGATFTIALPLAV